MTVKKINKSTFFIVVVLIALFSFSAVAGFDYYFGDNAFERIFDFHQEDRPNLLIFADSFTNVTQEWIASHFNKTVIIDLRARGEDFDLDAYIRNYDIDILLVTQYYNNLFFNGNMYIPFN